MLALVPLVSAQRPPPFAVSPFLFSPRPSVTFLSRPPPPLFSTSPFPSPPFKGAAGTVFLLVSSVRVRRPVFPLLCLVLPRSPLPTSLLPPAPTCGCRHASEGARFLCCACFCACRCAPACMYVLLPPSTTVLFLVDSPAFLQCSHHSLTHFSTLFTTCLLRRRAPSPTGRAALWLTCARAATASYSFPCYF